MSTGIEVDDRVGSRHLQPLLCKIGAPATLLRLPFGDVAFSGCDTGGAPTPVGVEVKRLGDLLSCVVDHRLTAHQLPGLHLHYDRVWVVVEGIWRAAAGGGIEEYRKGHWFECRAPITYCGLINYLTSLEVLGGVYLRYTHSPQDTARHIASLYQWWQKGDRHRSLTEFGAASELRRGHIDLTRPGLVAEVAARLPHVGQKFARAAGAKWKTIGEMVQAKPGEWVELGLAKKYAEELVRTVGVRR